MNNIVTIDIGSDNIRTVIAQLMDDQAPRVIGVGIVPSSGVRRSSIIEIEEVSKAIAKSVEMAELHSGVQVEEAYVSINGVDLEFLEIKGVVAVGLANGEVTESDVERSIEASQAINIPLNKEVVHIIPQSFQLDEQESVKDPIGMNGVRLEMRGVAVLAGSANIKNITKCLENNDIAVSGFVVAPLAAAQSALNKRQRELGSVLIELGAGVTSIIVYEEQEIIDIKTIPIGMGHVTNDVAIGLRTSIDVAEDVKLKYGSALPEDISLDDKINLADLDNEEESIVSRKYVAEIIEARVEEIFYEVEKELKIIEKSALLPAGVILSGGGAYVHGAVDLAKDILKLPAQIGFPAEVSGLTDKVDGPAFNVAIGMLLWVINNEENIINSNEKFSNSNLNSRVVKGVDMIKGWLKKFI